MSKSQVRRINQAIEDARNSVIGVETDIRCDIAEFVIRELKNRNMPEKDAAALLGCTTHRLGMIMRSECNLTIGIIAKIFHAFGYTVVIKEKIRSSG